MLMSYKKTKIKILSTITASHRTFPVFYLKRRWESQTETLINNKQQLISCLTMSSGVWLHVIVYQFHNMNRECRKACHYGIGYTKECLHYIRDNGRCVSRCEGVVTVTSVHIELDIVGLRRVSSRAVHGHVMMRHRPCRL